jgi:hypothetical protein
MILSEAASAANAQATMPCGIRRRAFARGAANGACGDADLRRRADGSEGTEERDIA